MDIAWGSEESHKFVTNIGLITSNGPHGNNIMAAEWTRQISYSPGMIAINLFANGASSENILHKKEFGLNLAAENQLPIVAISGRNSGRKVDKIAMLKEFGAEFYEAKEIDALMLKHAALNAEVKMISSQTVGDHIMFIGEVLEVSAPAHIKPLVYNGQFWRLENSVERPGTDFIEMIAKLSEKYKK